MTRTRIYASNPDERFFLHPDYELYETVPGQIVVVNAVSGTETILPDEHAARVYEWMALGPPLPPPGEDGVRAKAICTVFRGTRV